MVRAISGRGAEHEVSMPSLTGLDSQYEYCNSAAWPATKARRSALPELPAA